MVVSERTPYLMTSEAQLNANKQNAQNSTGPRTETGKAASSRNHLTFGLFTHADYVRPEEREIYAEFCQTLHAQLTPEGLLEETFTAEVIAASWRLRRCSAAEAELADYATSDPLLDDAKEKKVRSIERARAAAHSALNRSMNQLRKLQTERFTRVHLDFEHPEDSPFADVAKACRALTVHARNGRQDEQERLRRFNRGLESLLATNELGSNCNRGSGPAKSAREEGEIAA